MDELIEMHETSPQKFMIAGWQQWADAGAISSGLPRYLVQLTNARQIAEIKPDNFYLFQIPGTHHLLRPRITLENGHRTHMQARKNEFFATDRQPGLAFFLGEEPHQNHERYADAFFEVVEALGIRRVVAVGGVYGAMPYDKDREISCVYSLPRMKRELEHYAVRFSDYEGGSTIGTYLAHKAEEKEIEFIVFYGFVPAYDLSELSLLMTGLRIENDFKAWYDLMRRLKHMFDLDIDLADLEQRSEEVIASMDAKIEELDRQAPQLDIREHLSELTEEFEERPFMPLSDVWEQELRDLFDKDGDGSP